MDLPTAKGNYALVIYLQRKSLVFAGALGKLPFERGWYVYFGSAMGSKGQNLKTRISRHLSKLKRNRWHIDHLLTHEASSIRMVLFAASELSEECRLVKNFLELKGTYVPVRGFGSSDCKEGCPAHLVRLSHMGKEQIKDLLRQVFVQSALKSCVVAEN